MAKTDDLQIFKDALCINEADYGTLRLERAFNNMIAFCERQGIIDDEFDDAISNPCNATSDEIVREAMRRYSLLVVYRAKNKPKGTYGSVWWIVRRIGSDKTHEVRARKANILATYENENVQIWRKTTLRPIK